MEDMQLTNIVCIDNINLNNMAMYNHQTDWTMSVFVIWNHME